MIGRGAGKIRDQRGVALVLTLLILTLLVVTGLEMNRAVRVEATLAENFRDLTQASCIAQSAVEIARALIQDDDPSYDGPDERWAQFETLAALSPRFFPEGHFTGRIFDENSKFNPNGVVDSYGNLNLNPIKLKETAGFARVFEKTEKSEFVSRLGFGFRQTFGKSFVDPATKEKESFSSNDGGFEWQTTMKRPLLQERVLYEGGLLVFAPLFYSKSDALQQFDDLNLLSDDVAGYWKVPDVNFINSFTTNVTKVITVNLLLHFVYDKFDTKANVDAAVASGTPDEIARNIRKAGQFKQVLSLGLTYNLF